ncbi:hypothetical protein AB0M32_08655 [Streptomyces sp. NPDC051985]|uniref:hypothetical protein n=1 Tax=Streptomyces sp. NPDC051985 TaxID=3155807 RepID=UPI0034321527
MVDFWGLRLQLVCPLHGLPVACALTGAEADDRATVLAMLDVEPEVVADRPGRPLSGDKNYSGAAFEARRRTEHPPAAAGPQGRLPAQRPHRPAGQAIADRPRPLTLAAIV